MSLQTLAPTAFAEPPNLIRELLRAAATFAAEPDPRIRPSARLRAAHMIGQDHIRFLERDEGRLHRGYEPVAPDAPGAVLCLIVAVRDTVRTDDHAPRTHDGLVDLVACSLEDNSFARRLGHALFLGAGAVLRAGARGRPLHVYPDPLAWVNAGGRGAVLLQWRGAYPPPELVDVPSLVCHDSQLAYWMNRRIEHIAGQPFAPYVVDLARQDPAPLHASMHAPPHAPPRAARPALKALTVADMLARDIPPRADLLAPVLKAGGLAMVYARRGVGKTYFALGLAHAVASGSSFLRWQATRPRRVLFVDGEMPAVLLKQRLAAIGAGATAPIADPAFFRIITPDVQDAPPVDLADPAGQAALEPHLAGVELLILDNLATLMRRDDSEGEAWLATQAWLLALRRRGIAVLLVHHAGKSGAQRGTSRREDVLDLVLALKRPVDGAATDGARFEVHVEKARGLFGDAAAPFEAYLETDVTGAARWFTRDLADLTARRIATLTEEGLSTRDIAHELGVSKSLVNRVQRRAVLMSEPSP
jgi:hypothetical protein